MASTENLYQSILSKISTLPASYLQRVDTYLYTVIQESKRDKRDNREKVLALAGGWADMSETFFNEYLETAKKTGENMFQDRDITL